MSDGQLALRDAAESITALVESVFADLMHSRDLLVGLHRQVARRGRTLRLLDLHALRPAFAEQLRRGHQVVVGTGVIMAPGVLDDAPRWLEWWERDERSRMRMLEVDLDPDSVRYYDYIDADWFSVPQRTGRRVIVGPYVDYSGTDEYMLTLTVPVLVDSTFVAVAGADIPAGRFETAVLPLLRRTGPDTALVNAAGRIIATTTPRTASGALLSGCAVGPRRSAADAVARGAGGQDCPGLPWRLVTLAAPELV